MKLTNAEILQTLKEVPSNTDYLYVSTWRLNRKLAEKYPDKLITTDTLRNRLRGMEKNGNVGMVKDNANTLKWKVL